MKQYSFLNNTYINVPDNTCRGCYLELGKKIPVEIEPIWQNDFFSIRQDAECPVPGFYIISTRKHIHTIGDLSAEQSSHLGLIINRMRVCMKKYLQIERVHLILEEKIIEPHLHIWLLPLWQAIMKENNIDPKVWNSNILQYIQLFSYDENKMTIKYFNCIMKEKLGEDEILNSLKEDDYV